MTDDSRTLGVVGEPITRSGTDKCLWADPQHPGEGRVREHDAAIGPARDGHAKRTAFQQCLDADAQPINGLRRLKQSHLSVPALGDVDHPCDVDRITVELAGPDCDHDAGLGSIGPAIIDFKAFNRPV